MSEQLKECPFCGYEARLVETDDGDPYMVECGRWLAKRDSNCGCVIASYKTKAEAIAAWNRRVPAQGQGVPLKAIRYLVEQAILTHAGRVELVRQVIDWLDAQGQEATNE